MVFVTVMALFGLMVYANFANEDCDPYLSGAITNNNQVKYGMFSSNKFGVLIATI